MDTECELYNPDWTFAAFEIVNFPITFVGLSSALEINVGIDLNKAAYLKTTHKSQWMKFIDAQKVSAHHSAFTIEQTNAHTIRIIFQPTKKSILWAKSCKQSEYIFLFDLRVIKFDGAKCCYSEKHAEIGRYYIIGQCEYCSITHSPDIIDFGGVRIKSKVTRCLSITNESTKIPMSIQFQKIACLIIEPLKLTIDPNTTKNISVTLKPRSFDIAKAIQAEIRNNHDIPEYLKAIFIPYSIRIQRKIILDKTPKQVVVESMHRLYEPNPNYTYINEEVKIQKKKKEIAMDFLKTSKDLRRDVKKYSPLYPNEKGNMFEQPEQKVTADCGCKEDDELKISTYDLFQISILPLPIDFGQVGIKSYAAREITIKNNSQFDITVMFLDTECLSFTESKATSLKLQLLALSEAKIKVYYFGAKCSKHTGIFQYTIDMKYTRTHPYVAEVSYPKLKTRDKELRFGMVTSERFVTSVPVKLINNFNVNIDFQWLGLDMDVPFEIIPRSGYVPKQNCLICDILFVCKLSRIRAYEIELISKSGDITTSIPFELNIITKKISLVFLQPMVCFKDIPLNVATTLEVKLENSSKEFCYYCIDDPLIPGMTITPMTGKIRPRSIMNIEITVKICCVLEFSLDVCFKINNKESITLIVTGNVLEPKVAIHPKSILMPRIPSNLKTFVPVKFDNLSTVKSIVDIVQQKIDNKMCNYVPMDVFVDIDNEKRKITHFTLEKGQSKTVYLQLYGSSLQEYDTYAPFQINGTLGPPNADRLSLVLPYYTKKHEKLYENSSRSKVSISYKEISFLRLTGVVTKEWIQFSSETFHFNYVPGGTNLKEFTMTNVSKRILSIRIVTSKLAPNFTLQCPRDKSKDATALEFDLLPCQENFLSLKFHPKRHGRFVSTALLYLDKSLTVAFNNLTFTGIRQRVPVLTPSAPFVIFPPCLVTETLNQQIELKLEGAATMETFFSSHPQKTIEVKFLDAYTKTEKDECYTIVTVQISVTKKVIQEKNLCVRFHHESGAMCEIEISVCFTNCPLTTHISNLVNPSENPYPWYPSTDQTQLYNYMETCKHFLERWLFKQGFRNEFYPSIPDSLYALSAISHTKHTGMSVSYLSFIRRIAGPLVKRYCKVPTKTIIEESILVQEIHNSYVELIKLLKSRGSHVWVINAKFLLSHRQFVLYTKNVAPKGNTDILLTQKLLHDPELFRRLSKQSWIDFILQTYRVFVLNSCFFDCVCVSGEERDIIKILLDWYNSQIAAQHYQLRGASKNIKEIQNITTDLSDGVAIICALLCNCPFLQEHFSIFHELQKNNTESVIIHNASLIISALRQLHINFPINSHNFLKPNFVQMLFLSVHLYVVLPMFKPRTVIKFLPPLLKTSQRLVCVSPESRESLIFDFTIFNNENNCFVADKARASDCGNKTYLSIKYTASFVADQKATLLVFGYNKTRIFDTYIIFLLEGGIGSLEPLRRCKVSGHLYRPTKVEILVPSPFKTTTNCNVFIVNKEPEIPVSFKRIRKPSFFLRRLILMDNEIRLKPVTVQTDQEESVGHRMTLKLVCLTTTTKYSYIWFRSNIGEFYIKVMTIPRWDWPVETLCAKLNAWPPTPCSCEQDCECYRTAIVQIPHRNDLMVKTIRSALQHHCSDLMLEVFDRLIEFPTGRMVIFMMLTENGSDLPAMRRILADETVYNIKSRTLQPKIKSITLRQYSDEVLAIPITIVEEAERYNLVFQSECGLDTRVYRIHFMASENWQECFKDQIC